MEAAVDAAVLNPNISYRVDANDVLVDVDAGWDALAHAHGAPHLSAQSVLHRPIWDFVTSAETRHIHKILLQRVRQKGQILGLPFRCDAPESRRFMEMDLLRLSDGGVEFRVRKLREELRPMVQALAHLGDETDVLLSMCSWCNKFEHRDETWVEVEAIVAELQLAPTAKPRISHTICHTCMRDVAGTAPCGK